MRHSVYIVEDHDDVREGYVMFLEMIGGMKVCGAAATAEDALNELSGLSPDVIIVDISLPGMNGLKLVKLLRSRSPDIRLLVVSGHDETQYTEPAREAGADGFVRKGDADRILEALQRVLNGGQFFPAQS